MEEIVMDNDKTYGEIKKEQEVRSRLSKNKLQAREIPPS
jgi:hypothetical protein